MKCSSQCAKSLLALALAAAGFAAQAADKAVSYTHLTLPTSELV